MTSLGQISRVLSHRDFRFLWFAQSSSVIGDNIVLVALALFVIQRRPWRSRGRRSSTGDAAAAGYTAEYVSWRNPGSVSSSLATAPPGRSAASSTSTRQPACAIRIAADSPLGPDPTTSAS